MAKEKEATMSRVKPPLKWHGGKYYLAKKIIALMPKHLHYVEPYFGGGQVLFQKDPQGVSEVVNDIDGELMNFWRVLRDRSLFDGMMARLIATPFSQHCFEEALVNQETGPIGRAVAFFIKYRQSRQGLGKDFATLSRNRTRSGMNEQASAWLGAVEGLPEAHERLRRVVVLNSDALDVIRQQDGPNTLFYVDAPYVHDTRTAKSAYRFEMTDEQHEQLVAMLVNIRGKAIVSMYHHPIYDVLASKYGWSLVECDLPNNASGSKTKERKVECLWANYKLT